jgi:hypothetical protein
VLLFIMSMLLLSLVMERNDMENYETEYLHRLFTITIPLPSLYNKPSRSELEIVELPCENAMSRERPRNPVRWASWNVALHYSG